MGKSGKKTKSLGKGKNAYSGYGARTGVIKTIGGGRKGKGKSTTRAANGFNKSEGVLSYEPVKRYSKGSQYSLQGQNWSKSNGFSKPVSKGYGKGKNYKGKGKGYKGYKGYKGKGKGMVKGKGKYKGKGKGRGKGKGKGKKGKGKGKGKARVSKESLDKQLEEYMGPDALKSVLDQELEAYFKDKKALEAAAVAAANNNGTTAAPAAVAAAA